MLILVLSQLFEIMFRYECFQFLDVVVFILCFHLIIILEILLFFTDLYVFMIQIIELLLFDLKNFMSVIIFLSDILQSGTNLLFLFTACFPVWNKVIWLEKGIPLHICNFSFILLTLRNLVFIFEFLHNSCNISGSTPLLHEVVCLRTSQSSSSWPIWWIRRLWLVRSHFYSNFLNV